jgi:hypothetical protein
LGPIPEVPLLPFAHLADQFNERTTHWSGHLPTINIRKSTKLNLSRP